MKKIILCLILIFTCISLMAVSYADDTIAEVSNYSDLKDACYNLDGNYTEIKLTNDITANDSYLELSVFNDMVFDLNGYTLDLQTCIFDVEMVDEDATITFTDSSADGNGLFLSQTNDCAIQIYIPINLGSQNFDSSVSNQGFNVVFDGGTYHNSKIEGSLVKSSGQSLTFRNCTIDNYLEIYDESSEVEEVKIESLLRKNTIDGEIYIANSSKTTKEIFANNSKMRYWNVGLPNLYDEVTEGDNTQIKSFRVYKDHDVVIYTPNVYNEYQLKYASNDYDIDKITLCNDFSASETNEFTIGDKDRIFDLNGHTINLKNHFYIYFFNDNQKFTFTDSKDEGAIQMDAFYYIKLNAFDSSYADCELIINGGNYVCEGSPLFISETLDNLLVTIENGTFYMKNSSPFNMDSWNYQIKNMNVYGNNQENYVGFLNVEKMLSEVIDSNSSVYLNGDLYKGDFENTYARNIYFSSGKGNGIEIRQAVTLGDVDSNGGIDIVDVRLLLQAFISKISSTTWTKDNLAKMDMDGNKDIDVTDVRLLLQTFLKDG